MTASAMATERNTVESMKSTLSERVSAVIDAKGLPASRWSLMAGLAKGHVGSIKRGEIDDVQLDTLAALAKAAEVSYEWLATGKGSMDDRGARPSETTVEREPESGPSDVMSAIDRALFAAMDSTRFEPVDFDEARKALHASYRKPVEGADLGNVARRALEAARDARLAGEPVTVVAVLARIAFGRT